ncbi:LOB domain-containing protein 22 [Apostasia shenzhenica]|uniref:LOB domain-containing protein 22 n=1 Tax=Apostasia shenzhenica TaxID=1088818 RepID=A0A2I0AJG4_9ASPA|nr:LOB domain-containing protein 22 [Apostasia shenzhenica]
MSSSTPDLPNLPSSPALRSPQRHYPGSEHSCSLPTNNTPRPSPSSSFTSSSSSSACASCKYQRRRCSPDCILAPYFPADQETQFHNVHRLFGVKKIQKILESVAPDRRPEAMRSIIYQSNARAQYPVGGCYHIILDLHRQIQAVFSELQFVLRQVAVCQAQVEAAASAVAAAGVQPNNLLLNTVAGDVLPLPLGEHQQQYLNYVYCDGMGEPESGNGDGNGYDSNDGIAGFDISANAAGSEGFEMPPAMLGLRQQVEGEDEDVKPIVDTFGGHGFPVGKDEGNSRDAAAAASCVITLQCGVYVVNWLFCSSSIELKEDQTLLEQMQEHDLKRVSRHRSTFVFDGQFGAGRHIRAGAKEVISTAPGKRECRRLCSP